MSIVFINEMPPLSGGGSSQDMNRFLETETHNARLNNKEFVQINDKENNTYVFSSLHGGEIDRDYVVNPQLEGKGLTLGMERFFSKVLELEQRHR